MAAVFFIWRIKTHQCKLCPIARIARHIARRGTHLVPGISQRLLKIADAAEHAGNDINATRMHHETLVPRLPAMAVIGLP